MIETPPEEYVQLIIHNFLNYKSHCEYCSIETYQQV